MENNIISSDVKSSFIESPEVTLFELTLNEDATLYFHSGLDSNLQELRFHPINQTTKNNTTYANTYKAMPIMMDGLEVTSDGAANRPTLTIANVTNLFKTLLDNNSFTLDSLVGKRVTRRRTFEKYLVGGSSEASPYELPLATFVIERVTSRTPISVEFELASPFDLENIKIPSRVVTGKFCSWGYQGYTENRKGACFWDATGYVKTGDFSANVYYNIKDEPLILSTSAVIESGPTWSLDQLRSVNGQVFQSLIDNNTDDVTASSWRRVHLYEVWNSSSTYTLGEHAIEGNRIWRCVANLSTANTPEYGSSYWTRADLCSKTVGGCKKRFGAKVTNASGQIVSSEVNGTVLLPFGGFPGSDKFK